MELFLFSDIFMEVTSKDSLVSLSELYTGDWILLVSPVVYYRPFFYNKISPSLLLEIKILNSAISKMLQII